MANPKAVSPAYMEVMILDTLSKGTRQAVLETIMATPGAMIRLDFIQDWDNCDCYGEPSYIFVGAAGLAQATHDNLLAKGVIGPHYFTRQDWRWAMHCHRHAGRAPRPAGRSSSHLRLV